MRNSLKTFVCLFLLSAVVVAAQSVGSRIVDPFFEIEYDPARVLFESLPMLIKELSAARNSRNTKRPSPVVLRQLEIF